MHKRLTLMKRVLKTVRFESSSSKLPVSSSPVGKGYDILESDQQSSEKVFVRGYGENSFQINDCVVEAPVLLLPRSFFIWNCENIEDINFDKLTLFSIVKPTIEALFIGYGENFRTRIDPKITELFRAKGIIVEEMSTFNAASTFNVLNGEGRDVGAALLTMKPRSTIPSFSV